MEGLGHRKEYTCLLEKTGSGSSAWVANHTPPAPAATPRRGQVKVHLTSGP